MDPVTDKQTIFEKALKELDGKVIARISDIPIEDDALKIEFAVKFMGRTAAGAREQLAFERSGGDVELLE